MDPGQPIRVSAWFANGHVLFSYLAPNSEVPFHDPGYGHENSQLEHLGGDVYRYTIDTRGMFGGEGWWYFTNDARDVRDQRAKLGRFNVREAPRSLVDRSWTPDVVVGADVADVANGYEILAITSSPHASWFTLGAIAGALVLFLWRH